MVGGALQHVGHFEQPRHLLARGIGGGDGSGTAIGLGDAGAERVDQPENGEPAADHLQHQDEQRADPDALVMAAESDVGIVEHPLHRVADHRHRFTGLLGGEQDAASLHVAGGSEPDRFGPDAVKTVDDRADRLRASSGGAGGRFERTDQAGAAFAQQFEIGIKAGQCAGLAREVVEDIGIGLDQRLVDRAQFLALFAERRQRLLLAADIDEAEDRGGDHRRDQQHRRDRQHARAHRHRGQLRAGWRGKTGKLHGARPSAGTSNDRSCLNRARLPRPIAGCT